MVFPICFLACDSDEWQGNSTHYGLLKHIANFFNASEISWCNDALNLNEYIDMQDLHRTKRYNPGIGGNHAQHVPKYTWSQSESSVLVGMIIFGIILLCAFGYLCKTFAKNLGPQENYEINS